MGRVPQAAPLPLWLYAADNLLVSSETQMSVIQTP